MEIKKIVYDYLLQLSITKINNEINRMERYLISYLEYPKKQTLIIYYFGPSETFDVEKIMNHSVVYKMCPDCYKALFECLCI